ncbi:MAG: hypothetical protein RRZ65_04625 [Tannerellaceae bacterium]
MALEIKCIPVLQGKEAEEFIAKADAAFHNRPQTKPDKNRFDSLNRILRKAKMK